MTGPDAILDPDLAKRVANLTIAVRVAVEGALAGLHRSPHRGASVVFVEHTEYRPGDDLRRLDWKASARRDRHVIKRFEQESHLRAHLIVDASASMRFAGRRATMPKYDYAAAVVGALAYVLTQQGDAAGLLLVDRVVRDRVPPRARATQLTTILERLAAADTKAEATDLGTALRETMAHVGRRGLVVVASDLLDLGQDALAPLRHFATHGHEVWVIHVLDPDELDFPFDGAARFEGMEGEAPLATDADAMRKSYLAEMAAFRDRCRNEANAVGARFIEARTDTPVAHTVAAVLAPRAAGRPKHGATAPPARSP